jgi:iron complex transport system ATP-binding protein
MNETMLLKVNGLAFSYRSQPVLKGVEFAVQEHELLAILGPNGVGKTTLLKSINAILRPKVGSVLIEDENVLELDQMAIARKIAYVPQRGEAGRMTAFDAILLGRRPHIGWKTSERDLKLVQGAIDSLHLRHLSLRYLDEMSGGELQKINIARAIVQQPKVLLLDEPTSSLDLKNQLDILNLITTIVRGHTVSAVMTMHDLNLALRYAEKFLFLKDGIIFAAGGREVVTPEVIAAVYDVAVVVEQWRGCPVILPIHEEHKL